MGIKVWCLTGDKRETAINIGMSSKLINSEMNLIVLEGKTLQRCSENIEQKLTQLSQKTDKKMNALVVDGETLEFALNGELELKFLSIATQCHSVICCRVSPLQKSKVVRLVRTRLKCNTLAIGDGANDVSMIQAANIGVGIQGREGSQAVRAADYSFAEFRFLKRLLAVHGRYSYYRMASLILYSFYKNLTLIIVQWYFGFVNLWSGQVVYEQIFMTAYNIVFTSLPPFVLAVFDRDLPEKEVEEIPQLYKQVKQGAYWNWKRITWYLFSALWHSFSIFGCVYMVNIEGNISWSGQTSGYWIQCYLFGTPLLITVMLKIALETRYWVWLSYSSIALSIAANIVVMFILEPINYVEVGTPEIANIIAAYYFLSLFVPVLCCTPDVVHLYLTRYIWPSDADIVMEQHKLNRQKVGAEDMVPMRSLNSA
jgi:phospholipid-transporting ATPase